MTTEHDNINNLSELINTAPPELAQACVGMLHSCYGDSFASHSEVAAMMDNASYARATLFHSGTYGAEILSFFAGSRAQRVLVPAVAASGANGSAQHQFSGHADAPTTWCVVPDSSTENGYCGQSKDAAIHANFELAEELRKAILDIELMIEIAQGERVPQAERGEYMARIGRLSKIRRALYRSKDLIENLEA